MNMDLKEYLTEIGQIEWWLDDLKREEDVDGAKMLLENIKDACNIMLRQLDECK
jgi:hypothetical protein